MEPANLPLNLADMVRRTAARFPERPAIVSPGKDGFTWTYRELVTKIRAYAGALRALGLERGDRMAILSENCPEWIVCDYAAQSLGVQTVPVYPTLPADQASYIVRDCGAKVAITGDASQSAKLTGVEGLTVLSLRGGESLDARALAQPEALSLADWEASVAKIGSDEIATIIYTSGTTGQPKGAMLTHRGFVEVCAQAKVHLDLSENDVLLGFLPMSHVFERIAGVALPFSLGACLGVAKSLASLATDMTTVRPTLMAAVPRFLEATMDRILDNVKKQPPIRQKLFHLALSQGVKRAQGQFAPLFPVLDKLVGSKIRERVGGRMRFFVSGGAALPKHVAEFYMAMGITILQGYGLTETTGGNCINHPTRNRYWTVGEPLPGIEVKIAEDGEILVRGSCVMKGYFNLPDETAKAIDPEGWFHTGDIGEFEGTNLKITDRKKDILVLGNGKNIAPLPIESKLKSSRFIEEAVLFGDGMDYVCAIILPNFEALKAHLAEQGLQFPGEEEIIRSDAIRALIKKEIDAVNKTLANFELVKKHTLIAQRFTVEGGELTPTLKVKRRVIKERYAAEIAAMR